MSATILLSTFIAIATYSPVVDVKFDLPTGTKLTYKSSQTSDAEVMGSTMTSKSDHVQVYEVTGVEDGWLRVQSTLSEFKTESDSPMGNMMGDPSGLVTTFLVAKDRKVKDFKITNNGKLEDEQASAFSAGLETESKNGLDGLVFPEGEIIVGTTWEQELPPVSMAFGGMKSSTEGKLKANYKVLEINGSGANQTVIIESKVDGTYVLTIESPQGEFVLDVAQKETRTYTVRAKDGVVKSVAIDSIRDMTSQQFDVKTKTKGKIELVEA